MKKTVLAAVVLAVFAAAGCGGSGGGSTDCTAGENAAEAAFSDFTTILDSSDMAACLDLTATTCDCPNGGSVTVDQNNLTVTFDNCTSASNEVYEGTLTLSDDLSSLSANMATFDGCTNLTATDVVVEGGCSGTVSATCGGQTLTCTMGISDGECVPGDCTC